MIARTDWLLLFLGSPGGPFETDRIRVMKGMFLLDQEGPDELRGAYRFHAYDYGPFDIRVYHDLEALEREGLIRTRLASGSRKIYHLTALGTQRVEEVLRPSAAADCLSAIEHQKRFVTSRDFADLLRDVYARHPKYAVRSKASLPLPARRPDDVIADALRDDEFMSQFNKSREEERRGEPTLPLSEVVERARQRHSL